MPLLQSTNATTVTPQVTVVATTWGGTATTTVTPVITWGTTTTIQLWPSPENDRRAAERAIARAEEAARPDRFTPSLRVDAAQQEAARARAIETLMRLLPEIEQARFRDQRVIRVCGSAGGLYEIEHGYQRNVYGLAEDGTRTGERYCAHPRMDGEDGQRLPYVDAMIAQLLTIQIDEPAFLAVANRG